MTIHTRLEQWKESGVISAEQHTLLSGLARGEPFSIFLELNILLYVGVLAFVGGLGWTVTTWSQQLGDVLVLAVLSALLAACLWYCFRRAANFSWKQTPSPSLIFDYVLYLGSLVWTVELAYLESRFHLLSGQWDDYLLATAFLFFFLAYRFDNRFVLSLALSALAGWFGLTISRWPSVQDAQYREYAILYGLIVAGGGAALEHRGWKPHFFATYLNIAANVLFWALLAGVFEHEGYLMWLAGLLLACAASLAWGLKRRRSQWSGHAAPYQSQWSGHAAPYQSQWSGHAAPYQFSFVAYAAVYGYIGVSSVLLRNLNDTTVIMSYFVFTGIGMLTLLGVIARRLGRES